jgi:dTDP-4-dehydrorhamnose 3,5-epimerase
MLFRETDLPGVFTIEVERITDERGFFARTFCMTEFEKHGLSRGVAQCNLSYSKKKGTLRGMHYQLPPHAEAKLVRCDRGAIYDVIIDLRPVSPAYCKWISVELSDDTRRMLYVPEGCAHGFQTLTNDVEVFYQMSAFYSPDHARGVRYDDPLFQISWPISDPVVSEKDRTYGDYRP